MNRLVLALSLAALTGCKTGDMLRAAQKDAAQYQENLKAEQARSAALKTKVDALQAELARAQDELKATDARLRELQTSKQQLEVVKADLERKSSEYEQLAGSLKGEIEAGRVELTELRGKMTVKMKDKVLFSSGSAALGKDGRNALQAVADALRSVQGKTIRVEGHTDDIPTARNAFPTNWELSTARSLAVVRFLQSAGVDPAKLAAAGYSQFQPIADNETAEGRSQNRRIEIVLAPAEAGK